MVPLGCGCVFALFAVASPRLALLIMWVFTPLVDRAFGTFVAPLLGLAFLPFTTIMYVVLFPVVGFEWFWVGLGLLADISSYAGSALGNRKQIAGNPAGAAY